MIGRKALSAVFLLTACYLAFCQNAYAMNRPNKLSCPKSWPEDPKSKFLYLDFTQYLYHYAPDDFYQDPSPYTISHGEKLDCFYANGRSLLVVIPGNPKFCFVGDIKSGPRIGVQVITSGYCTYDKTGDPAKDEIRFKETEPLNLSTSFYGARLGMTRAQAAAVLAPRTPSGPSRSDSDPDQEVYVLKNQQQLALTYSVGTETVQAIELRPPLGRAAGLQDELIDRFGFPLRNNDMDEYVWRGEQGTRLALEVERRFGNLLVQDERLFFLDGRDVYGLDKSIGLDEP